MKKVFLRIIPFIIALSMLLSSCSQMPSKPCGHADLNGDYICDTCQEELEKPDCTTHSDVNGDLACDVCGEEVPRPECTSHSDANGDLTCDVCGEEVPRPECTSHSDANGDLACDVCGENLPRPECTSHSDANGDLACDVCGENLPRPECTSHSDANGDLACDVCGENLPRPKCTSHSDANGDLVCDVCGEKLPRPECSSHSDANGDLVCDVCGEKLPRPECTSHLDANRDLVCDVCGDEVPRPECTSHADANGDLVCDVCGEKLPRPECTSHSDVNGDFACDVCGCYVEDIVTGWLVDDIPAYNGGTLSEEVYLTGQGIDAAQLLENEGVMQIASKTNNAEFKAYIAKLVKAGYEKEFYRSADGNFFASYVKDDIRVYAYFMCQTREVRIIKESTKISSSLADFGYVYKKKQGEQSVIYQLALAMNDATHAKPDFKDNGMFYLIKLADNSVIVIDGANGGKQFDEERSNQLMNMLWEITGKREGETVKIAGWFITHSHGDHHSGFRKFVMQYSSYLDLERVFFALPSLTSTNEAITSSSGPSGYRSIIETVCTYFSDDDPIFLRMHTGQNIQLADISIEVLQTQEDLVDATTGESTLSNYNDASTVIKLTIDGETFLILGDLGSKGANKLTGNWSSSYLRADGIQLAHHVMNDVTKLYKIVRASVVFVPQSQYGINVKKERITIFNVAKSYAREDMIFFQNEVTVGIAVVNGQWEKVYSVPFQY